MPVPESDAAPPTPVADAPVLTSVLLYDLGTLLQRRLDAALDAAGTGLRTRHFAVLAVLGCRGSLSQRAAADDAGVDPATMVKTVDDLERLGLVTRTRSTRDRRIQELALTPAGAAMRTRAEALLAEIDNAVFARLGADGHDQLRRWLTDLLAEAERASP